MNCVNCGAPLHGEKCGYCGTEYKDGRVRATFGDDDWIGLISVGGKEYRCYLSKVEIEGIMTDAGRTLDGKFRRGDMVQKHKFTLIEI